ncbi:MAG: hypothetical protein AMJ61_00700 [Desulfobacterales bacterium SG8_35_2]|nr:MAG: hypothetical protein AMJ61_00700 [Desulfobacterales bacterium SG8_35_2]
MVRLIIMLGISIFSLITIMELKIKLIWKIIFVFLAILLILFIWDEINSNGIINVKTFFLILFVIVFEILLIFVAQTFRIELKPDYISTKWNISVIFFSVYNFNQTILVKKIASVNSFFPYWFPFHIISILGEGKIIWFGFFLTRKKDTFYYLSKIIDPYVMDRDANKIFKNTRANAFDIENKG